MPWLGFATGRRLSLTRATRSRYAPGRLEAWFRSEIYLGTGVTSAAPEPPLAVVARGKRFLPGWTSLLLIGGDTTIGPHRDARPRPASPSSLLAFPNGATSAMIVLWQQQLSDYAPPAVTKGLPRSAPAAQAGP